MNKFLKYKINNFLIFFAYLSITILIFYKWIYNFSESILGNINEDGSLLLWILHWPLLKLNHIFDPNFPSYLDSNIFTGFSGGYSFSEMFPLFLPVIYILNSFFTNPILNQNILHIFFITLFPFSLYLFLRELRISFLSSFIVSILFSFTSFHMVLFIHFQQTISSVVPLLLVYLLRFLIQNKKIYLLYFCLFWIFLAGTSTHAFLFGTFSSSLIFLSCLIYIFFSSRYSGIYSINSKFLFFKLINNSKLLGNNLQKINLLRVINIFKDKVNIINISILLFSLTIIFLLVYPYLQNSRMYGFTRLRVESILFELKPFDYIRMGFDNLTIMFIPIAFYYFFKKSHKNILFFRFFFLLSFLIYLISLGPRPFYPNSLLYKFYPGFSSIRDISRILVLFWFFFAYCTGAIFDNFLKSNKLNTYIKVISIFILFSFEIILIKNRTTEPNKMEIPDEFNRVHTKLMKNELEEPHLVITEGNVFTSYVKIDSLMQYKSIENEKKLVGGYSGYMPYNLVLLRHAIASYISGTSDWKEEEILQVLKKSPANSISFINIPPTWKSEIPDWRNRYIPEPPLCKQEITGKWRNLTKISKNYGLILGYSPADSFCVSEYGRINDLKLKIIWKKEGKPYYKEFLKFTTPFYRHPSAQELLYSLDGFRDLGFYTLEIYQDEKMIYEGVVEVH